VSRLMKLSLLALALTTATLSATVAMAGYREIPAQRDIVLVTPEGDILDYLPDEGRYRVRYDPDGNRIYIDRYGMVVATEMPAARYYHEYDIDPNEEPDTITGSVQQQLEDPNYSVDRQPLPEIRENPGLYDDQLASVDPNSVDPNQEALPEENPLPTITLKNKSSAEITALQTFLDRAGASPGVIDGKMGSNVTKAIIAWQEITGETLDPNNTDDILERLRLSGGLAITDYTITAADAAGPYVAEIPEDYSQKASLPAMSYTSTTEALAERFHMDEAYLKELNPGVDFTQPGVTIKVVDPGPPKTGEVARIVANKRIKMVQAFDSSGALSAAYPASIGSNDTPSPSGTHTVARVALDPNYTYNPKINFQQGNNDKVLTLPPVQMVRSAQSGLP